MLDLHTVGTAPCWQITAPVTAVTAVAVTGHETLDHPAGPLQPGTFAMTDHGGAIAKHPRLLLVWFGNDPDRQQLEQFASDMLGAGIADCLSVYGVGQGTLLPSLMATDDFPPGATVADTALQQHVQQLIADRQLPAGDGETLVALMLPDGVTVNVGGALSCSQWCGIHEAIDQHTFISIQPGTGCSPCHGASYTPLQARQAVLWHEYAEFCTDKVPGQGFYDDRSGQEIADPTAWQPVQVGPYLLQPVVGPDGSAIVPQYRQPQPQPVPAADFSESLPFWRWVIGNEPGVLDALDQLDAFDSAVIEQWRAWFRQNGYLPGAA